MKQNDDIIAKKYANAFLNIYLNSLSINEIEQLEILENFLHKNKLFYVSLRIPTIDSKIKRLVLEKIVANYHFKKPVLKLMLTLLDDDRIIILDKVLKFRTTF